MLHFHGGLNSLAVGMAGAQRLHANYVTEAGAYPIFSVWESGLQETIRNNLKDILGDSVFQELVKNHRRIDVLLQHAGDGASGRSRKPTAA